MTTIPHQEQSQSGGTIVVGVDTSEASRIALRWAHRQAKLTESRLRVVMTWDIPPAVYMVPFPEGLNLQEATEKALADMVGDTFGGDSSVAVTTLVVEGHPAPVLIQQAQDADLLVVGSRGHGEFTGMLLGSVSEHCVTHAPCPVVVVRTKPEPH